MQTVLNFYHSIPSSFWALLAAGIAVSGVMQGLKHWFFSKLSPSALVSITSALSFLAAGTQYFSQTVHNNPGVLGVHTAAIFAGSQWVYRYLISPSYKAFIDARSYRNNAATAASTAVMSDEAGF